MTSEEELLLLSASPVRSNERTSRIAHLREQPIDWNRLENLAHEHRLTPLLHWELQSLGPAFRANLKNSLLLTRELVRVIDLLAGEGIPALPFKGPTLAIVAYKNLALRSFGDLDILVRHEDVWRVRDLLYGVGYTSKLQLKPELESAYLDAYDELVMYSADGNTLLEIHWAFVPPHFSFELDFLKCWSSRAEIPLANRSLPTLGADDLLLVLSVHGSKHCWSHLGLVCDVAWLLTHQSIDLPRLLERARDLGVRRMVLLGIALANRLYQVPVPPVSDEGLAPLVDEIVAKLFGEGHDETSISANASLHMRMRERRRDRLRYFFRLATRPGVEDWESIDLPNSLSFLYALVRYPRLAMKYAAKIIK